MQIVKLRERGNSFVVTVPRKEVERLHLREGDLVNIQLTPAGDHPQLAPDLEAVFDEVFTKHEAALRYLAER